MDEGKYRRWKGKKKIKKNVCTTTSEKGCSATQSTFNVTYLRHLQHIRVYACIAPNDALRANLCNLRSSGEVDEFILLVTQMYVILLVRALILDTPVALERIARQHTDVGSTSVC